MRDFVKPLFNHRLNIVTLFIDLLKLVLVFFVNVQHLSIFFFHKLDKLFSGFGYLVVIFHLEVIFSSCHHNKFELLVIKVYKLIDKAVNLKLSNKVLNLVTFKVETSLLLERDNSLFVFDSFISVNDNSNNEINH